MKTAASRAAVGSAGRFAVTPMSLVGLAAAVTPEMDTGRRSPSVPPEIVPSAATGKPMRYLPAPLRRKPMGSTSKLPALVNSMPGEAGSDRTAKKPFPEIAASVARLVTWIVPCASISRRGRASSEPGA